MNLKYIFFALFLLPFAVIAQSKTTEALHKSYGGKSYFLYHNTLRMLNQVEDPAYDELIKDVEKIKFLMIKKETTGLDMKKIISDYKAEEFEAAMTSRHEGRTFDVFLKGDKKTEGMLILVNDEENLMVLDVVGFFALDKVNQVFTTMEKSSDLGGLIKRFTNDGKDKDDDDKSNDKDNDNGHH